MQENSSDKVNCANEHLTSPSKNSHELLSELKFCVFDLETTGGNHNHDEIIDIGMVKIQNLKVVAEKHFLINPSIPIPEFIQQLTSIRPENLKDAPRIEEVLDEIIDFMQDDILVAHNKSFDIPFFNAILVRHNRTKLTNKVVCTNMMTKYLIPDLMSSNLNYMSRVFNIKHQKAHRAIEDAHATAELLIHYLHFFIEKGLSKVNQLYYPKNKFELDRTHFRREQDLSEILTKIRSIKIPFTITFKGSKGIILANLPVVNAEAEFEFIQDLLKKFDWQTLTLKLEGPEFEGLLHFAQQFSKLSTQERQIILNYLEKRYAPKENKERIPLFINECDFLITRHLINGQFVLYPLFNLGQKTNLIFRYPAHKKKLLQFMNNQLLKIEHQKGKRKYSFSPEIIRLLSLALYQMKEESSSNYQKDYFFINKKQFKSNQKEVIIELDRFVESGIDPFNYPVVHL